MLMEPNCTHADMAALGQSLKRRSIAAFSTIPNAANPVSLCELAGFHNTSHSCRHPSLSSKCCPAWLLPSAAQQQQLQQRRSLFGSVLNGIGSALESTTNVIGAGGSPRVGPRRHSEERVVPFPAEMVYNVVADVPRYKEFVPYTVESKVLENLNQGFIAELTVGFGPLHERYISRVECLAAERCVRAKAEDAGSMFKTLVTEWQLLERPLDKDSCLLKFRLDFEFHSELHNHFANVFFEKVSASTVDAFLDRCKLISSRGGGRGDGIRLSNTIASSLPLSATPTPTPRLSSASTLPTGPTVSAEHASITTTDSIKQHKRLQDAMLRRIAKDTAKDEAKRSLGSKGRQHLMRSVSDRFTGADHLLCELETCSHFSLAELERIKHNFERKAGDHPRGVLNQENFTELFCELFKGSKHSESDLLRTAQYVFKALDLNQDKTLSLNEFVAGLSTVMKGTSAERSRFWFRCYDINADGIIDRNELYNMVYSSIAVRNALLEVGAAKGSNTGPKHGDGAGTFNNGGSFMLDMDIDTITRQAVKRCFGPENDGCKGVCLRDLIKKKIV